MKKIYFTICILLLSTSAFAQYRESHDIEQLLWDDQMLNILLDTRFDLQGNFPNGDFDNFSFEAKTFRLWIAGEIIPGIKYRVRHRFNRSQTAEERDGLSKATDHAWVSFDIGKKWTLRAGKQAVQFGTYEYDYNSADTYVTTMICNDLDANKIGVNAAYKFGKQTMNLQVVNSDAPQFAHTDYAKKAMAALLLWEGDLFNGIVKTRWGYGALQHTKSKIYNWLTLGTQLNIHKFTTEIDYYLGDRNMNYGSIVSNPDLGTRLVRDQSLGVNLKYDLGKWKPFVKGVWNQRFDKDFGSKAYESYGIQAVVEYYPFTKLRIKDLRFHAMYAYNVTDFKAQFSNLDNNDEHTLLVGMRWMFKAK